MAPKSHPSIWFFQNHKKCNFSHIYVMRTVCFMRASVKRFWNTITDPPDPSWRPTVAFYQMHKYFLIRPQTRDQLASKNDHKKTQNLLRGPSENNFKNVLFAGPLAQGVLEYKDAANKPRCKLVVSLVILLILCPGVGGDPPAHTPFVAPSMSVNPKEGQLIAKTVIFLFSDGFSSLKSPNWYGIFQFTV